MFRDILTGAQQALLELLSGIDEVRTFYLAGGTALALHPRPPALARPRLLPRAGIHPSGSAQDRGVVPASCLSSRKRAGP